MARDTNRVRKSTEPKSTANSKESGRTQSTNEEQKDTRGWKDVFDNSTYSSGPGDNIYVFG